MDRPRLLEALQTSPDTPLQIIHMQATQWGRSIRFEGLALADSESRAFSLLLADCRELRWQRYTHLDQPDDPVFPPTMLAGLRIGRGQHRRPLNMLCEHFACVISYESLNLLIPGQPAPILLG